MKNGIKHLIECHCVLPQFRDKKDAIYHKFVVFSEIDDKDNVVVKNAQCNNCGVIHKVIDITKSEIVLGKEASSSLITISDIKLSLPTNVISILETYNVPISTWEEVSWILENNKWGSFVVLDSENKGTEIEGKLLRFNSFTSIKIESFSHSQLFPL